ncbi:MAG: GNAT family N-acetyltransferase [Rickettsiales bacterium]
MIIFKDVRYGSPKYNQLVARRRDVLRMPLGLDFTPEQLAADMGDIVLGAFEKSEAIGSLIIRHVSDAEAKLRQMAVAPLAQGKGIGSKLLAYAEDRIRTQSYREISLHAREDAVPFYEKHGYKREGLPFIEVTIPHVAMRKVLD